MNNEDDPVNAPQDERVPIDTLEKVADAQAFELWGENVGRGDPIPLSDASGICAYVFPYAINARHCPSHDTVFGQVRALRSRHNVGAEEGHVPAAYYSDLRQFGSGFGSVCVSARHTDGPILWMSHFLAPFFTIGESAKEEAIRRLGGEARLRNY